MLNKSYFPTPNKATKAEKSGDCLESNFYVKKFDKTR